MQTLSAYASLHEVAFVARADTFVVLQQQVVGACETILFSWSHASFACRMALMAMAVFVVFSCWAEKKRISKTEESFKCFVATCNNTPVSCVVKNQILFRFQLLYRSLFSFYSSRRPLNMKNQKIRLKLEYRVFVLVSIFDVTQRRGQSTANGDENNKI